MSPNKKRLLRWCGWFFTSNIVLFWLLGLSYLSSASWISSAYLSGHIQVTLAVFLIISYLGQLAILALIPSIPILLIIFLYPRQPLIILLAILLATISASLLLADAMVYHLFHFHLPGIVLKLIFQAKQDAYLHLSTYEYITCFLSILGILLAESILAFGLNRTIVQQDKGHGYGKWIIILLLMLVYLSVSLLYFSVKANKSRVFFETARVIPLYTTFLEAILPSPVARFALDRAFEVHLIQPEGPNNKLHYPLHPLTFNTMKRQLNVVLIVIEMWRFDLLDETIMPHVFALAKKSSVFTQHFSGGNATGPGIFSLFYGLPAIYWTSMEKQRRGPLLIDELLKRQYQTNILVSGGLYLPAFDKTVFSAIPNLKHQFPGKNSYERDRYITSEFKTFLRHNIATKRPFFSFLFYDSTHGYCAIDETNKPFQPAITHCDRMHLTNETDPVPYLNRYKNALHLIDEQISLVIQDLESHQLLDQTVVIVTGDHGEAFNDNHLNNWGHSSNFTRFQVQTPLVIYWPGRAASRITHVTTHFDIAATLMQDLFACQTPGKDYSLGDSLWVKKSYPYRIAESYIGLGVIEPDRITTIYPSGYYQLTDLDNHPWVDEPLHGAVIYAAFQDLQKFFAAPINIAPLVPHQYNDPSSH